MSILASGQNRSVLGNVLGGISTTSLGPVYPAVSGSTEGSHVLPPMDSAEWGTKQAVTRGFCGVSNRNLSQPNFSETRNCLLQNKLFLGLGVQAVRSISGAPSSRFPSGLAVLYHFLLLLVASREPAALSDASRKTKMLRMSSRRPTLL